MAFVSKLKDAPDILYFGKEEGGAGFKDPDNPILNFVVALSGHKDLGLAFQALDGAIRAAASLGARNAAGRIWYLSQLQVPVDKGDLQMSGKVQKGERQETTDMGAMQRKVGNYVGKDESGFGATAMGGDGPDASMASTLGAFVQRADIMHKPISEYNIVYEDPKAWFVHEVEQDYHQAGQPRSTVPGEVPDSEGRRRGTKFLERAINEVAPNYPDWVAAEIEKMVDSFRPPPPPPKPVFDGRPRLVKRIP